MLFQRHLDHFPVLELLRQWRPERVLGLGHREQPLFQQGDQAVDVIGQFAVEVDRFHLPAVGLHHAAEELVAKLFSGGTRLRTILDVGRVGHTDAKDGRFGEDQRIAGTKQGTWHGAIGSGIQGRHRQPHGFGIVLEHLDHGFAMRNLRLAARNLHELNEAVTEDLESRLAVK